MMSPRLLPTADSFLIMAPSLYVGTNDVPTGGTRSERVVAVLDDDAMLEGRRT